MKNRHYRAAILMAAYGNSLHFSRQVFSITNQMSDQDILIIVDDGSAAVDWQSITSLPANYIFWTRIDRLGASHSFIQLILKCPCEAKYYLISDQDDIWSPNKISYINNIYSLKNDSALALMHAWRILDDRKEINTQAVYPLTKNSQAHYFFETPAPGMAMSFNNRSLQLIRQNSEMLSNFAKHIPHDRLLAIIFSTFGRLEIIDSALVHYRQHTENLVGAPSESRLRNWIKRLASIRSMFNTALQCRKLYIFLNCRSISNEHRDQVSFRKMRIRSDYMDNWILQLYLSFITKFDKDQK